MQPVGIETKSNQLKYLVNLMILIMYTWNLFVLYFWAIKILQNKALSNQNKGHLGSRYKFDILSGWTIQFGHPLAN